MESFFSDSVQHRNNTVEKAGVRGCMKMTGGSVVRKGGGFCIAFFLLKGLKLEGFSFYSWPRSSVSPTIALGVRPP